MLMSDQAHYYTLMRLNLNSLDLASVFAIFYIFFFFCFAEILVFFSYSKTQLLLLFHGLTYYMS